VGEELRGPWKGAELESWGHEWWKKKKESCSRRRRSVSSLGWPERLPLLFLESLFSLLPLPSSCLPRIAIYSAMAANDDTLTKVSTDGKFAQDPAPHI
jgi:hypothetical protein